MTRRPRFGRRRGRHRRARQCASSAQHAEGQTEPDRARIVAELYLVTAWLEPHSPERIVGAFDRRLPSIHVRGPAREPGIGQDEIAGMIARRGDDHAMWRVVLDHRGGGRTGPSSACGGVAHPAKSTSRRKSTARSRIRRSVCVVAQASRARHDKRAGQRSFVAIDSPVGRLVFHRQPWPIEGHVGRHKDVANPQQVPDRREEDRHLREVTAADEVELTLRRPHDLVETTAGSSRHSLRPRRGRRAWPGWGPSRPGRVHGSLRPAVAPLRAESGRADACR